jgi:hypothetical protein
LGTSTGTSFPECTSDIAIKRSVLFCDDNTTRISQKSYHSEANLDFVTIENPLFHLFDWDGSTSLDIVELCILLWFANLELELNESLEETIMKAKLLMKMCDINQSGVLEYHEYLLFLPETVKVVK